MVTMTKKRSNKIKLTKGELLFDFVNYTLIFLFIISILYPFWNTLLLSFADQNEATNMGLRLWIDDWSLEAYKYLFKYKNIGLAYFNTIFRTVVGTALGLLLCFLAAYPLSKKNLPFRNFFTMFFVFTMFFNGGMVPLYLLIKDLHLIDSLWSLILPVAFSAYHMVIMRNFISGIDIGLEESAMIDGAGQFTIAFRIFAPLLKPVLATVALWKIVGHWNSWFDSLIYIQSPEKQVLQTVVRSIISSMSVNSDAMEFSQIAGSTLHSANVSAAAVLVTIGPIILVYPFLQKYFVKGILVGSLKG